MWIVPRCPSLVTTRNPSLDDVVKPPRFAGRERRFEAQPSSPKPRCRRSVSDRQWTHARNATPPKTTRAHTRRAKTSPSARAAKRIAAVPTCGLKDSSIVRTGRRQYVDQEREGAQRDGRRAQRRGRDGGVATPPRRRRGSHRRGAVARARADAPRAARGTSFRTPRAGGSACGARAAAAWPPPRAGGPRRRKPRAAARGARAGSPSPSSRRACASSFATELANAAESAIGQASARQAAGSVRRVSGRSKASAPWK